MLGSQLNCSDAWFNCSDACFSCLAPNQIGQMLDSIARLPVQLVGRSLLMTGDKLNCSDKLKTVLLGRYKALVD